MTAPSWVTSALEIDGLEMVERRTTITPRIEKNDVKNVPGNLSEPIEEPHVHSRWVDSEGRPSLTYTSTSKEHAWKTCQKCPEPRRNASWVMPRFTMDHWSGTQRGTHTVRRYTKRCTACNTKAVRIMRSKRLLRDIQMIEAHLDLGVRWVTLTAPNYPCRDRGLIDFKKKVKRFRDRKEFRSKVVGTAEFYEWTLHPDDRAWSNPICWNIHLHALWIGDYWPQKALLKSWGEGGARIEDARTTSRRCLNYVISYAKKQQDSGIRAQNRTGCLYGSVFAELKSAAMLLSESRDADDAQE